MRISDIFGCWVSFERHARCFGSLECHARGQPPGPAHGLTTPPFLSGPWIAWRLARHDAVEAAAAPAYMMFISGFLVCFYWFFLFVASWGSVYHFGSASLFCSEALGRKRTTVRHLECNRFCACSRSSCSSGQLGRILRHHNRHLAVPGSSSHVSLQPVAYSTSPTRIVGHPLNTRRRLGSRHWSICSDSS